MVWGVAFTHPNLESKAIANLSEAGFECFHPQTRKSTVKHGKRVQMIRPLFPRYLIVRLQGAMGDLFRVRDVKGAILTPDKQFREISDGTIAHLQTFSDEFGFYDADVSCGPTGLQYGQKVTPKDGVWFGHFGSYDSAYKNREFALFSLFGREARVSFKQGDLLAA